MAIPSYTEDLTDIHLMESTTGVSALGGGGAGLSADIDFAIQGTTSITKQVTGAGVTKGLVADNGATITMGADDHAFVWVYATCPGLLETNANGGMRVTIGTTTGNYNDYYVAGNDTYTKGGHFCYPIRYTTSIPSPGSQTGTPGANPQWFGGQLSVTGTLRAANLAVDASRYGTGAYITAGEIANPATFDGFATQNDLVANQWGILTAVAGGFSLQGKFVIGQDNTKTATLAYFEDSDIVITLADTPHSLTDFTQIIIDHASSTCNLTNITITALGTNNPGQFLVNANNPTTTIIGGTWTSLGIITLQSNTSVDGTTFRTTDQLTLNSATLDNCIIDKNINTAAVIADDLGDINNCTFNSDGTGHAVDLGIIAASITMSWDNQESGYAGTDGVTGNETILVSVDTGQTLTINVAARASIPTIYNTGVGTVTVVSGQVTTLFTVKSLSLGTILVGARVYLEAAAGGPLTTGTVIFNTATDALGQVTDTRSLASNQPVSGWIRMGTTSPYYQQSNISATIDNASGLTLTFQMVDDE